jgi:cation diffusion facilitator CzcD-associated flavoprotein CzcO
VTLGTGVILDDPVHARTVGPTLSEARTISEAWLRRLEEALREHDTDVVGELFQPDGWWRDFLTLTWDMRTLHGIEKIRSVLKERLGSVEFLSMVLSNGTPPEFVTEAGPAGYGPPGWIQSFFEFETDVARGRGVFRLLPDAEAPDGGWKAWTFFTGTEELKGYEEPRGKRRLLEPEGIGSHKTWLELRGELEAFEQREPKVLIIGGGQHGLSLAARLGQLGLYALVVEKNARLGDKWRQRYKSLVLHDAVWYDHMPYLPFPETWPVFAPKDKFADWLETYATTLELNVWTSTEVRDARYDEDGGHWDVRARREDGTIRTLHPAHVVMATGHSGEPRMPAFEGLETFEGTLVHSSAFPGGEAFAGKTAVVVGACNSGHDIAQELYEYGADVTLVQRSGTCIMTRDKGVLTLFKGVYDEDAPPTDDADLLFASIPFPVHFQLHRATTKVIAEIDRDILDGLAAVGFKLDFGEDGSGAYKKYLQRGGGYYIDVGCSQLIADRKIKLKQGVEIDGFTKEGVVFADGTSLNADIVVLATGYEDMRETARPLFGDEVIDRCSPVWGLDDEGELRSVWRGSGFPGLWFVGGNLMMARFFSRFLALKLKAIEEGLIQLDRDPVAAAD